MNKSNSSEEKELPLYKETEVRVPIHLKITLTIREAAEYSNIGINKIDSMLKQPNCPFVLYVGTFLSSNIISGDVMLNSFDKLRNTFAEN